MIRPIDVVLYIVWFGVASLLFIDTFTSMLVNHPHSGPNTTAAAAVIIIAILAWLFSVLSTLIFGFNIENYPKAAARIKLFCLNRLEYRIVYVDWVDNENEPIKQVALETRFRFPVTWGQWVQTNIYHREYNEQYVKDLKSKNEEDLAREIGNHKDTLAKRKKVIV